MPCQRKASLVEELALVPLIQLEALPLDLREGLEEVADDIKSYPNLTGEDREKSDSEEEVAVERSEGREERVEGVDEDVRAAGDGCDGPAPSFYR
jgi:hypothetical protein